MVYGCNSMLCSKKFSDSLSNLHITTSATRGGKNFYPNLLSVTHLSRTRLKTEVESVKKKGQTLKFAENRKGINIISFT